MNEARVDVEGMSCGHCVAAVKRALEQVEGVDVRRVEIGSATVSYDPDVAGPDGILSAIEDEGYRARLEEIES